MNLLITGATGYIGTRLTKIAQASGHNVYAATRRKPSAVSPGQWVAFNLDTFDNKTDSSFNIPEEIDAIIHLAAITIDTGDNYTNAQMEATRALLREATRKNIPFVFVSSQTARPDASTEYGRCKYEIEKIVFASGGMIVRPGQVYGGVELGQFGLIVRFLRKSPVFPVFLPRPLIQPIHVDDLASCLIKACTLACKMPQILNIAESQPIPFDRFLQLASAQWNRQQRLGIPIPQALVTGIGFALGRKLSQKTGIDRFNSLFDLRTMSTNASLRSLGVSIRSIKDGMSVSGNIRRRELAQEGKSLLEYILSVTPTSSMVKKYIRAVEALDPHNNLDLPKLALRFPATIAIIDGNGTDTDDLLAVLSRRLNFAVAISESAPQRTRYFLDLSKESSFAWTRSMLGIIKAVTLECLWRLASKILRAFYKRHFLKRLNT